MKISLITGQREQPYRWCRDERDKHDSPENEWMRCVDCEYMLQEKCVQLTYLKQYFLDGTNQKKKSMEQWERNM